jgi:predicted RNA-binding protein
MYDVKIIGAWRNAKDPNEEYLITAYSSATHYSETIAKIRENKRYKELTEIRQSSVDSTKVTTLTSLPGSPNRE